MPADTHTEHAGQKAHRKSLRSATELLDARAVAELLSCSPRHVVRLADSDRLPRPVHLGALVRWLRADLEKWLAAGCPRVETNGSRNHA